MLKCVVIGILLTAFTVGIHAAGTMAWFQHLRSRASAAPPLNRYVPGLRDLCLTATVLLLLTIVEVTVWALTYLALPNTDELNTLEEAIYFSMVTFTSLGYGDIVIGKSWRLLSGIEAITGLLIFGWSTAALFAVIQRLWKVVDNDDLINVPERAESPTE